MAGLRSGTVYFTDLTSGPEVNGLVTGHKAMFTTGDGVFVADAQGNIVRLDDHKLIESISGSLKDYTLLSTTTSISGDLQSQIDAITIPTSATFVADYDARYVNESDLVVTLGDYTLLSTTASVSASLAQDIANLDLDLQTQISAIIEEGTTIASSGGSILVTQNGNDFNLEVASAPVSNHNSLLGIQGGTSGQYYHLTATEYASISGSSGSYVPYTGATTDVNLGTHKINVDAISFNQSPVTAVAPGQISWNSSDKTFDMGLTSGVTLQVGQEELIRVHNNTGSNILNGQPVYISGYNLDDEPLVSLAGAAISGIGSIVVGVATETILTGDHGFATVRGKVRDINTSSYVSGQKIYLGETPGTFTADISGFALSSHINTIGYIGTVDAISGSLYISINNEQTSLSLSGTERNILIGNSSSTGVYEYSGMTVATSASFTVPPLKGIIVDNTGVYATAPHITNVVFAGGTYPVTNILTDIATYVLINRAGVISQQVTYPTPEQRRDNIFLGKISHQNKSSITVINNTSDYDVAPLSALRDMFAPIAVLNEGILPYADGANLSFNKSAGSIYGMGINWVNNNKSPNKITFVGSLPTTFDYYTQTAVFAASQTLVTPGFYDLAGTRTAISATGDGGGTRSTNIRVYQFISGRVAVQYGQTVYSSLANAVASTQTESFVKYPALPGSAVLIGIISVRRTATVLNDTAYAIFTPASIFGEATGGTAGLSTTTLQQAYDNSTTPEIVINATLDGLTIKNGTGNADNVTHLLEGQNTAGTVTSFIMADGTFKSAYSVVDSISGASGSIVIHDATGKLLDSGFTIADISGGIDLSSYTPLTTTASISGDLQVQINNCLTNETGVEFLVDSFNNGGIEYGGGNTSTWGSLTTATIIGNSSGATAEIRSTTGTTSGFLSLTTIVGDFIVGETITSSNGKTVTVVDFKKQMVSVERILNTTSNKDVFLYGAPWGLNESIKTLSSAPNQIFWAGQNASWLFASTSFNSDISIQKEYRGALLTTKSITLGWEGGNAELNVGGTNIIRVVNSITNLNNNPIAIGNTTDATNLLTGSLRVAGGMSSQKSIRGASIYAVDISGSSGNIVTHDADGKLLDSGILATDLASSSTVASISGDLQVQINNCLTNETGVEFLVDSVDNGGIEYIDGDGASWNTTTSIIGSSSGATATVRGYTGTTTGFLALTGIVGDFQVGETITSQQSPFKVSKVAQFKKQMVSVERVQSGSNDVFLYGAPWGLNERIKDIGFGLPNQIFWAGQNANWLFASTGFNSDISIQREFTGGLDVNNTISLGWEGIAAQLNVGDTIVLNVLGSTTTLENNQVAITNTTEATDLLTGSLRVSGGISSQKSIRGASVYAVDVSGANGNIVTHDADGKLLDSGILTTDLTLLTTSASISGDLQVQINSKANSSDLSNYTLLTTTASISGDFEVRINSLEVTKEDTNEPNGFINRTDSTLYYDATTATFAISGNYAVYLDGNKFLKTGDSATLTPAYGTQYIYYVYNTGDFTVSPTLFNIAKDAPVAYVFFNDGATDSFLAEERHGITMDGVTHQYLHRTVGSKYVSGMMLGDYILNSDTVANNKYSISEGTFYDEDILNEIPALPDNGPYNIFYRTGASGNWTWSKTQAYPYLINANSIRYNQFTGGSWQLTDITNITTSNRWVNYYVFATNAITSGFEYIIIPGQAIYTSLTLAKGESVANLSLGNLPFAEIVPVARVTHQFSAGYATANGRARIVAVASLTATSFVSAIATASNHNSLSGLQGGVAGEYYHLTSTEYDDLIGSTEVASISGDLQSQISAITVPTSATFVADYDNRYVNITGDTMTGNLIITSDNSSPALQINSDGDARIRLNNPTGGENWAELSFANNGADRYGIYVSDGNDFGIYDYSISGNRLDIFDNFTALSDPAGNSMIYGDEDNLALNVDMANVDTYISTSNTEMALRVQSSTLPENEFVRVGIDNDASISGSGAFTVDGGASFGKNVVVAGIAGTNGNIVTHDANGKLLDSGILATSLASASTVASISGDLQSQINSKQDIITLVAGSNISILESPSNTFTINASISGGGYSTFGATVDGGTSVPTSGSLGYWSCPSNGVIKSWDIFGDVSGSCSVDVRRATYASFPTFSSIAGSEKPALSSQQKNRNTTISTWSTSLVAGDVIEFYLESATTLKRINVVVKYIKE